VGFVEYLPHLAAGMMAWQFISAQMHDGALCVIDAEGQLKSTPTPISVLAARMTAGNVIILLHNAVPVALLLNWLAVNLNADVHLTRETLYLIPGVTILILFGFFAGIVLGPICARFRDVPQIVGNVMQMLFFLTPIIWMQSSVSHRPALTNSNPF